MVSRETSDCELVECPPIECPPEEEVVLEAEPTLMGEALERLRTLDLRAALREVFGKCPTCGKPATGGRWLKWCKACNYVAPINRKSLLEEGHG